MTHILIEKRCQRVLSSFSYTSNIVENAVLTQKIGMHVREKTRHMYANDATSTRDNKGGGDHQKGGGEEILLREACISMDMEEEENSNIRDKREGRKGPSVPDDQSPDGGSGRVSDNVSTISLSLAAAPNTTNNDSQHCDILEKNDVPHQARTIRGSDRPLTEPLTEPLSEPRDDRGRLGVEKHRQEKEKDTSEQQVAVMQNVDNGRGERETREKGMDGEGDKRLHRTKKNGRGGEEGMKRKRTTEEEERQGDATECYDRVQHSSATVAADAINVCRPPCRSARSRLVVSAPPNGGEGMGNGATEPGGNEKQKELQQTLVSSEGNELTHTPQENTKKRRVRGKQKKAKLIQTCAQCGYTTTFKSYMRRHIRVHTGERPFRCNQADCGASFSQKGMLTQHLLKEHEVGSGNLRRCNVEGCTFVAACQSALDRHKRVHTGERPFRCSVEGCNYTASWRGSVYNHQRIHQTEKRFRCPHEQCTFATAWKISLRGHLKRQHNYNEKVIVRIMESFPSKKKSVAVAGNTASSASSSVSSLSVAISKDVEKDNGNGEEFEGARPQKKRKMDSQSMATPRDVDPTTVCV